MGVIFESGGTRAIRTVRGVTAETERRRGLSELRVILRAVRVMARRTRDAPSIHHALDEIVALHAVLVRRAVGIVREVALAEGVRLELPKVLEPQSDVVANRPVIRLPIDKTTTGLTLGMALDA